MRQALDLFNESKPVIGMLHLGGLPGRPWHDTAGGMDRIVEDVSADLQTLQAAGVDGVMFCNEKDIPYQLDVGNEISAAMAAVIAQVRRDIKVPFGVNILWDPMASLAVAKATGARWIREVLTGVYETDLGMLQPKIGEIAGYRRFIDADDVLMFDNIQPEFASALGSRSVADRARAAEFLGLDAILVSGAAAGVSTDLEHLRAAKGAVTSRPVIANTGVRADNLEAILEVADAVIVGTSLKVDGVTWNPVDSNRATELMAVADRARRKFAPALT